MSLLNGLTSGGEAPIGSASGDLSGSYPNPTVAKIQGKAVSATPPTDGQVLTYVNANSDWEPATPASGFTAGGDLTGTSTNQQVVSITGASGTLTVASTGAIIQWAIASSAPTLKQADQTANSTNGQVLTLQSQNATGTTSTGGALALKAGTGTTAGGAITFNTAATTTLAEAGRVTAAGAWQFGTNTNQSTSGSLNFQNNTSIAAFRNAANSADVIFLASNNANDLGVGGTLGHANQCRVVQLNSTLAVQAFVASTQAMNLQLSSVSDFISLGASTAAAGLIRTPNNVAVLNVRNAANSADAFTFSVSSANTAVFSNSAAINMQAGTQFNMYGNSQIIGDASFNSRLTWTTLNSSTPVLQNATANTSFTLNYADSSSASTGGSITITAQNTTAASSTGGSLTLAAGTGTSTNGTVNIVTNELDWDNAATFRVLQTKGSATTTDATTAQTLVTYTPINNSAHSLDITVVGYNTANNNDCYKANYTLTVVTTSNTPVIVGVNSPINVQTNGSGSTYVGPTVAVSGSTITLTTKGAASTTVHWMATCTRSSIQ